MGRSIVIIAVAASKKFAGAAVLLLAPGYMSFTFGVGGKLFKAHRHNRSYIAPILRWVHVRWCQAWASLAGCGGSCTGRVT